MIDRTRLEAAVRETLLALGEDPDRAGLADTPRRTADAWEEFFAATNLSTSTLPDEVPSSLDVVIVGGVHFVSVCEHHLLPFSGLAHVAYQPSDRLMGLSDVPRIVRNASAGLHLQEHLTKEIAEQVRDSVDARGVLVLLDARHGCMADRGVRETSARASTLVGLGTLDSADARSEVLRLLP